MNDKEFLQISNVFFHVEQMKEPITAHDFTKLEQSAAVNCERYAGKADVDAIRNIDLTRYHEAIERTLRIAVGSANAHAAKAIYFEFDMDYEWRSFFFICPNLPAKWNRLSGVDFIEEIEGPTMPDMAETYGKLQPFAPTLRDSTMVAYLIARTFSTFGKATRNLATPSVTLGMAFHDQEEIIWI